MCRIALSTAIPVSTARTGEWLGADLVGELPNLCAPPLFPAAQAHAWTERE